MNETESDNKSSKGEWRTFVTSPANIRRTRKVKEFGWGKNSIIVLSGKPNRGLTKEEKDSHCPYIFLYPIFFIPFLSILILLLYFSSFICGRGFNGSTAIKTVAIVIHWLRLILTEGLDNCDFYPGPLFLNVHTGLPCPQASVPSIPLPLRRAKHYYVN